MATAKFPRLNIQHEYLSIDFGNGRRFTVSHSGKKTTGAVPDTAWKWMLASLKDPKTGANYGEQMQYICDHIAEGWPEWNVAPRAYKVGEAVVFDFGPRRGGKDKGTVEKVLRTSVTVRFERTGLLSMPADMLDDWN